MKYVASGDVNVKLKRVIVHEIDNHWSIIDSESLLGVMNLLVQY